MISRAGLLLKIDVTIYWCSFPYWYNTRIHNVLEKSKSWPFFRNTLLDVLLWSDINNLYQLNLITFSFRSFFSVPVVNISDKKIRNLRPAILLLILEKVKKGSPSPSTIWRQKNIRRQNLFPPFQLSEVFNKL